VLDIHPEQNYETELAKGDDGVQRFYGFWTNFARHFANTDPAKVYFEVLNEPHMDDVYRWEGIQARAVEMIRTQAPAHTIIATGGEWGSMDGLLAGEPVRDDNVIYSFHDYDPMWFTHQGASWGAQGWVYLRGVPYPSTMDNVAPLLAQEPDDRTRLWLARYGMERWDHQRIEAELDQAVAWAAKRHVPLWCGEFGVYRDYAPPAMRAAWIRDMRTAMEARGIGWAMWDYQGGFGLVSRHNGVATPDPAIVAALGLTGK
jgi:aryl-phospho-beta-D-glucosidase BglC (GH1 family)